MRRIHKTGFVLVVIGFALAMIAMFAIFETQAQGWPVALALVGLALGTVGFVRHPRSRV